MTNLSKATDVELVREIYRRIKVDSEMQQHLNPRFGHFYNLMIING